MNEATFFKDLAVLMSVAGLVAVVFSRFGWPKVIGYLLAGILLSPHTWGGGFLADDKSVSTLGQLGVVFLMFTLGLEFSLSEMKRVKSVSVPVALFDSVIMICLGYTVGTRMLGWGTVASLFLGAAICDSATTLLAKTIDEMKWSARPFVRYVLSTSVCEDVLCVGVIALITGVAHGKASAMDVGRSLGGLAVFFTGVLVFGLLLVPRFLDSVARTRDSETLLLALLGCCFFVTFLAFHCDFSIAIGAFLVGVLGSSSDARRKLTELVAPLRNTFAAVFFISIGYLVDPAACWRHAPWILALSALVLVGKCFNCFATSVLAGQSLKDAVQTGFGLAQIGEFAYMVAFIYLKLTNDADQSMFQIVVGVSLLTTLLNPFMLKVSDPVGDWLVAHVPGRVHGWLSAYGDWLLRFRTGAASSEIRSRLRSRLFALAVVFLANVAVLGAAKLAISFKYANLSAFFEAHKKAFFCLAADGVLVLMLVPASRFAHGLGRDIAEVLVGAGRRMKFRRAVQAFTGFCVRGAALALVLLEIAWINVLLLPGEFLVRVALLAFVVGSALFGWRRIRFAARTAGHRLRVALDAERRRDERRHSPAGETTLSVPRDYFAEHAVAEEAFALGRTIRELDVRARTGASIVAVTRAGERFRNPGPDWRFCGGDLVMAIGNPPQIAAFRELLDRRRGEA